MHQQWLSFCNIFVHIYEKKPSQSIATECEQLANAYSKELSCLHLVTHQMSWQQASSHTSFVHIYQEEPRQSVAATNEQLANCIFHEANFGNCCFNS